MEIRKLEEATYEAPELTTVGNFDEVTLGRPSWGFETDWSCVMLC